ncbi:pyrroline-5-carboxylate reductase [Celerinatantimonas sp. YJH-8]|uniref:pyrroline-5-carboxylate reductase n=1 Tax=Celerinatantimonas sp. YJH-8 TaxID=3228714 RepID=UPI0038C29482
MTTQQFVFIGAGHMASSLIGGMVRQGISASTIGACDHNPGKLESLQNQYQIATYADSISAMDAAEVVILAVKPQVMQDLCQTLKKQGNVEGKLFISIAAGIRCEQLQNWLGHVPIIRCMPNLPAKVGEGVTGVYAPEDITASQKQSAERALSSVGQVVWLDNEAAINHIIAIAGSAPAYFFLFMDAMQQYAQELGFSEEQAREMVTHTALGSVKLALNDAQTTLATMCQNVAVKGGTTAEAVQVFEQAGLRETVKQAMQAAIERGQQLERQL